jgi:hypothetical protein
MFTYIWVHVTIDGPLTFDEMATHTYAMDRHVSLMTERVNILTRLYGAMHILAAPGTNDTLIQFAVNGRTRETENLVMNARRLNSVSGMLYTASWALINGLSVPKITALTGDNIKAVVSNANCISSHAALIASEIALIQENDILLQINRILVRWRDEPVTRDNNVSANEPPARPRTRHKRRRNQLRSVVWRSYSSVWHRAPSRALLLSPSEFAALGRNGHLTAEVWFCVLPTILRLSTLVREPSI